MSVFWMSKPNYTCILYLHQLTYYNISEKSIDSKVFSFMCYPLQIIFSPFHQLTLLLEASELSAEQYTLLQSHITPGQILKIHIIMKHLVLF